jgi:uncharacterized protein (DUF433 family)
MNFAALAEDLGDSSGFDFPVLLRIVYLVMENLLERITVNPRQCGGRPCVRGMRIRVSDVLDLFASSLDASQILAELPDLEADDLKACLLFARRRIDHPVLAV